MVVKHQQRIRSQFAPQSIKRAEVTANVPGFLKDERGEMAPASYLIGVGLALVVIFFTVDLGIRKGARLAVEYAAYCGARAAATQVPLNDQEGACLADEEQQAVKLAAAACLTSVVSKRGSLGLDLPSAAASLAMLVKRADSQTTIRLLGSSGELQTGQCLGHNEEIAVEVSYDHYVPVPLSPFQWHGDGHTRMVAQASTMLHTVR